MEGNPPDQVADAFASGDPTDEGIGAHDESRQLLSPSVAWRDGGCGPLRHDREGLGVTQFELFGGGVRQSLVTGGGREEVGIG